MHAMHNAYCQRISPLKLASYDSRCLSVENSDAQPYKMFWACTSGLARAAACSILGDMHKPRTAHSSTLVPSNLPGPRTTSAELHSFDSVQVGLEAWDNGQRGRIFSLTSVLILKIVSFDLKHSLI